jgi:hypothetical protein
MKTIRHEIALRQDMFDKYSNEFGNKFEDNIKIEAVAEMAKVALSERCVSIRSNKEFDGYDDKIRVSFGFVAASLEEFRDIIARLRCVQSNLSYEKRAMIEDVISILTDNN